MRKMKRLTAAVLTAALALALAAVPVSAAPGSFTDVSDANTAVNADILRLMGVVTGTGGNRFNPGETLTRAQFCVMTINFLQRQEELPQYATRTIFNDVRGDHWARSYINMAASTSTGTGEGENSASVPLMSGVGDGRFLPDSEITLAEAATILIRALQYTSKETGAVWPQGYMDLAKSIGLTDGITAGSYDAISRAQAAQLFVNALSCKTAGGKIYYETIGATVEKKAIILAVNAQTDDGSASGAIRAAVGGGTGGSAAYLPAYGDGNPAALQGRRGDLVLNDEGEVLAFIPDSSAASTVVLTEAQPGYIRVDGGKQYTVTSGTPVYTTGDGQSSDYLDIYANLPQGTQLTLYVEKGKVTAIYAASGTTSADSDAVVVMGNVSAATFHDLTGGLTSFNIVKNRQSVRLSDIKPYDVVTYDQFTNTLMVSDVRMTAVYTDPSPTPKNPTKINVLGNDFAVLKSAWDTIGDIKPGDSVSLLLTADGNVAGIVKAVPETRSTAVGVIEGGSAQVFLSNGGTLKLSGSVANSSGMEGQLVIVSAGKTAFSVSRLPENRAPGALSLSRMKLGDYTVAAGVRFYERVSSGAMAEVSRSELTMDSIPADSISAYHLNSANMVDYVVLNDVTGNAYIYGMMVGGYESVTTSGLYGSTTSEKYVWYLRNGGTEKEIKFTAATTYKGKSGDMVGVVVGKPISNGENEGQYLLRGVTKLTEVKGVTASDFFTSEGGNYVTVKGQTYPISGDVQCYYNRSGNAVAKENWLAGGASGLASLKTYSDSFTLYIDPVGKQVRIVAAN